MYHYTKTNETRECLCCKQSDHSNGKVFHPGNPSAGQTKYSSRSESCPICQSGNRTGGRGWTLEPNRSVSSCSSWLLWSSCLECERDYDDVWGGMFSFTLVCSFLPPEGEWVFSRGGERNGEQRTKWTFCACLTHELYNNTQPLFSSVVPVGEHLLLSLWWLCEKLLRCKKNIYKYMVYWLEWTLFIECFFMQSLGQCLFFY